MCESTESTGSGRLDTVASQALTLEASGARREKAMDDVENAVYQHVAIAQNRAEECMTLNRRRQRSQTCSLSFRHCGKFRKAVGGDVPREESGRGCARWDGCRPQLRGRLVTGTRSMSAEHRLAIPVHYLPQERKSSSASNTGSCGTKFQGDERNDDRSSKLVSKRQQALIKFKLEASTKEDQMGGS